MRESLQDFKKNFQNAANALAFSGQARPTNPSPTIDISHSTLNICTETITATTMRIVWPTTFVTLSDDEARVSGNVSLRSPRRQKVRDEGCLSTACTRSPVLVTESTGVTIASWHWYISFFSLFLVQSVDQEGKYNPLVGDCSLLA